VAGFVKGDVVVVPFPFSDLTQTKRRPALVISPLDGEDVILCQITSQQVKDSYAIPLRNTDFLTGKLSQPSNVRPNRLFTADSHLILYRAGNLTAAKMTEVVEKLVSIVRS
jgi:mRNA interferase MazF